MGVVGWADVYEAADKSAAKITFGLAYLAGPMFP